MKAKIDTVDFKNLVFGRTFTDHMIVVKYADKKWGKIELLPYGPLELLPSISALHYGQAVFEGMKVFRGDVGASGNKKTNGKNFDALVFRPDAHIARFNRSLARLDMPAIPEKVFNDVLAMLIKKDSEWLKRAGTLYIRPFVFATSTYLGVATAQEYIFSIITCPVGAYYTKPLKLKVETEYSRSASGGVGFAKAAGNYAASLLPTRLAHEAGFDQLIWTDAATHTKVEESGTMNIFCVIDGVLTTPKLSNTILAGINRDSLLTLARDMKIKVKERDIPVAELVGSLKKGRTTEIFGVGTAVTVINAESVTHAGKTFALPKPTEFSFSTILGAALNDIKNGIMKDPHGWVRRLRV